MSDSEEDSYSTIFTSLKHPIRRRLLRILSDEPQSFSDLQKQFKIESSHLTYHIESLRNLLYKTPDGKYALSSFGEAAVSMMKNVEEPPKALLHKPIQLVHRIGMLKLLTLILIGVLATSLVFNAVFILRYNELNKAYAELMQVSEKGFRMYLLENNTLFVSDSDIECYNWTSQEIFLTHNSFQRLWLMGWSLFNSTGFVIKIDGAEVYSGIFMPFSIPNKYITVYSVSIVMPDPPRIGIMFPSEYGWIEYTAMRLFFPKFEPPSDYPEKNAIIFQHFENMGILIY